MPDEIHIPAEALEPKPWWPDLPNEELIKEIVKFIAKTGRPHLWAGQTYTRPPGNATIIYLAEFDLPKSHCENRELWAPCPCCTPFHPKYCKGGKIAYFPEERVIRIIGPDCFGHINEHGHVQAMRNFHADVQRKKDIAYLLDNLGIVPELIGVIEHAVPAAEALDELRVAVRQAFDQHFQVRMWDHVRDGVLRVRRFHAALDTRSAGDDIERETELVEVYGTIAGYSMLKPHAQRCGLRLKTCMQALRPIDFGSEFRARVQEMSDADRHHTSDFLGRAIRTAVTVFEEIHDVRQFTTPVTIATLNGWSRSEGSPLRFQVAFEGTSFYLGRDEDQFRRIPVAPEYQTVLRRLPLLGRRKASAA